jgi:acyl-CoA dehydrogenase
MPERLNEKLAEFQERVAGFALREIAPLSKSARKIPLEDIWKKLRAENLTGLAVPEEYGGMGSNALHITAAAEALTRYGRDPGIVLSWLIHVVLSRFFILRLGTEEQRGRWLPSLAGGEVIGCLAASEPEGGGHPKAINTAAERAGGDYILTGVKNFLTNGPVAGLFIVIAVSGRREEKKEFTAFLVPQDRPGLSLTETMKLGVLESSPHCGLRLEKCPVPAENILGEKGDAYRRILVPFRNIEDVFLKGLVTGGMSLETEILARLLRERDAAPDNRLKERIGGLLCRLEALRVLAYEAAVLADRDPEDPGLDRLQLSFREIAGGFQDELAGIARDAAVRNDGEMDRLQRDLSAVIHLAKNIARIRLGKIGGEFLKE